MITAGRFLQRKKYGSSDGMFSRPYSSNARLKYGSVELLIRYFMMNYWYDVLFYFRIVG